MIDRPARRRLCCLLLAAVAAAVPALPQEETTPTWRVLADRGDRTLREAGPAQAEAVFEEALAAARTVGDENGQAYVQVWLGQVYGRQGEFAAAGAALDAALAYYRSAPTGEGAPHPSLAAALGNRSIVARRLGDLDLAARLLGEQIELVAELPPERQAPPWNNLGSVHYDRGDLRLAEEAFRRSLTLRREAGDLEASAIPLGNLANVLTLLGEGEGALALYREAVGLHGQDRRGNLPVLLRNLALHENDLGDPGAAAEALREAERIALELGESHVVPALVQARAEVLLGAGELEAAVQLADRAIEFARQQGDLRHEMMSRLTLAEALARLGRHELASRQASEAVRTGEKLGAATHLWRALTVQALASRDPSGTGLDGAGLERLNEAIEALESWRDEAVAPGPSRRRFLDERRAPYHHLIDELVRRGRALEALTVADRARARTLLELLGGESAAAASAASSPITAGDLTRLLGRRALLAYTVGEEALFVFWALPDRRAGESLRHRFGWERRALPRDQLRTRVEGLRSTLAGRALGYRPLARELGRELLPEIVVDAFSASPASRPAELLVVPDDALWQLPWLALETEAGPLLDLAPIAVAPSLRLAEGLGERRAAGRGIAWAGQRPWPPTAPGQTELRTAADLAASSVDRARLLHFAGHGQLVDGEPLRSSIELSLGRAGSGPAASPAPRLVAESLLGRSLSAELLTLAACETGRGAVGAGEGVAGFSWAALQSGARNVLATLWRVDAEATRLATESLYRPLLEARTEPVSLAVLVGEAARRVRARPGYEHPFYWAAWQLVGAGHVAPAAAQPFPPSADVTRRPG